MPGRLEGRIAIVTGSTMGIGRATANVFAREGARVVVHGRSRERGEKVVDEITRAGGTAVLFLRELAESAAARELVDFTVQAYGGLDVLVNNARSNVPGNVVELEEADWDLSMSVMLKVIYLTCKYAIPVMLPRGGGSIINISSVHGYLGFAKHPAYDAAKAALINLSRQMAVDFGPQGLRVNSICPGGVINERTPQGYLPEPYIDPERERQGAFHYPLRRFGRPVEIANAALFLASDEASFVTGHALVVDGGMTARLPDISLVHEYNRTFPPAAPETAGRS